MNADIDMLAREYCAKQEAAQAIWGKRFEAKTPDERAAAEVEYRAALECVVSASLALDRAIGIVKVC